MTKKNYEEKTDASANWLEPVLPIFIWFGENN
jgi:hypothetical protein